MTKVRIRCRVPAEQRVSMGLLSGVVTSRLADWSDVEVFAVDEAGAEMALTNVDAIEFKMAAGCEPARVVLTMLQPELDIEGEADAPDVVQRGVVGNDALEDVDRLRALRRELADARGARDLALERARIAEGQRDEMIGGHCPGCEPPGCRGMVEPVAEPAPAVVLHGVAGNDGGPGDPVQLGRFMWPAGERLEAGQACELRSDSRVYPVRPIGLVAPLTPPRPAPGSRTAIERGLEAVIRDACPNVGGFELYPTREGTLRIALRGRGITPAEVNAVHAAAMQLVPVAIVPLVEVSESERDAAGWARWSADEIARFLRGDPPVKP